MWGCAADWQFPVSLSLQKWKPKGTALQHMVSGLCLDSQTPAGPLVVAQCLPQMASQSWEPQIITWATGRQRRERGRLWTRPLEGLGGDLLRLSLCWGTRGLGDCIFVMSTSSSCSLWRVRVFLEASSNESPEVHGVRCLIPRGGCSSSMCSKLFTENCCTSHFLISVSLLVNDLLQVGVVLGCVGLCWVVLGCLRMNETLRGGKWVRVLGRGRRARPGTRAALCTASWSVSFSKHHAKRHQEHYLLFCMVGPKEMIFFPVSL